MKKRLLILIVFVTVNIQAQIGADTPWMQNINSRNTGVPTLAEITRNAKQYWKNHDKDRKGSGYKPFKRWEQFWSMQLNADGRLKTRAEIQQAWEAKQAMKQNSTARNTNVVSNWTSIGPYAHDNSSSWSPGQGRVNFAIVGPNNANTYYVGSPAGGIWKSTDSGSSWTALSDQLPQIGVSGIAIDYNDSNTIYIATGDDDALDTYSVGVLKSTDGGTTWNTTGLVFGNTYSRSNDIYINPNDSNMLWVATSDGVFKTTDGGLTWANKLAGDVKDLKIKPNDYNVLYAVKDNKFHKSTDAGETFIEVTTTGLPTNTSRMAIAVTPANPAVVYLLNANTTFEGVYKSTDSGANFIKTNQTADIFEGSNQAYYDMAITVSDTDENVVFTGVLNIWKSIDGGDSFLQLNNWSTPSGSSYTHADIHFLRYYDGVLFAGTDGGVYRSIDNGANFTDLTVNGLAIGQFYRAAVSKESSNNVVGGLQDNGGFGFNNNTWYSYHGADGMDCAIDPNNSNTYYGFIQNGSGLYVSYDAGLTGQGLAASPGGISGNWITPLVVNSVGEVYAGYDKLYKLTNGAFSAVSGAVFSGNINFVEIDPLDNNTIYVSKGTNLYKSTDRGVTFTNINTFNNTISSIEVNNQDSNTVYVSTYSSILKSTDGATTWTDITYNLPSDSKNIIRHQNHHPDNPLYVGTSLGVYYLDDTTGNTWQVFDTNLPNVSVTDLEINIIDHKITAATYGRGAWQSPIANVPPADDIQFSTILSPVNSISCDNNVAPMVKVFNNGTNVINQIDFNYTYDGATTQNYTWNGSLAAAASTTITLPNEALASGLHELNVISAIANDTYSDNNSGLASFQVNNTEIPSYLFTFEDINTDSLLTAGGAWEIATPTSTNLNTVSSGTKAYCVGANADYPANTTAYLYSRCYDLTTINNPILTFQMAFRTEVDWDVIYMQYSLDGINWNLLGTAADPNWYNNTNTTNALNVGNQWSGIADNLQEYSYDLAAFTNETTIQFRFVFASDGYVNEQGVVVDDFVINGTLGVLDTLENSLFIHPNPSQGIFKISWNTLNNIESLQVYTISGKLVKKVPEVVLNGTNYELDLNNLSKGVYLLKINSANTTITKKLVLK